MGFGGRLKETRKARGLTAIELGELAQVSNSGISRWEQNQRAPGGVYVARLAKALGVNERWLMTGEGPKEPGPVTIETPTGRDALEAVLWSYEWPEGVTSELVTEVEAMLRAEAYAPAGISRSASAWRHRAGEILRARDGNRKSRPRLTGGSK